MGIKSKWFWKDDMRHTPPEDWRKKQYLSKRRINDNDPAPVIQAPLLLKPGWRSTLLTLLIFNSVVLTEVAAAAEKIENPGEADQTRKINHNKEAPFNHGDNSTWVDPRIITDELYGSFNGAEQNALPLKSLEPLIHSKITIDPRIPEKKQQALQCEGITKTILQTTDELPVSEDAIRQVLDHPEFKLVCTSPAKIRATIGRKSVSAFFTPDEKAIFMASKDLKPTLVHHEFTHAANFFRHTQSPCETKNHVDAVLPFYPPTKKGIKNYEHALNLGDRRIRYYKKLWNKKRQGKELTRKELGKLKIYDEAAQDCIIPRIVTESPPETYERLLKLGWQAGMKNFTLTNNGETREVLDVKKTSKATIITMRFTTKKEVVFNILDNVKEKLNGSYRYASEKIKLAERDAYTFQSLSKLACETFYREAYSIRTRDKESCSEHAAAFTH